MIRYTTTTRIFSLLNRLLLIAKFNLGPIEMERNFILICYPLNKEKRNRGEQFYSIKMINIGHEPGGGEALLLLRQRGCAPSLGVFFKEKSLIGYEI